MKMWNYQLVATVTKQCQGRYTTKVRLCDDELKYVDELPYLGHIFTLVCQDNKDTEK